MSILNIVKTVKEIHKEEIIFVKIGKFYQVYGKDAYIISYLLDYKLKKVEEVLITEYVKNFNILYFLY